MKYLLTIIILISSLALFGDSKIEFKSKTVDFGEIESGKNIDLNFEFKNSGDTELIIKSIRATCGCTVTRVAKKNFQPGESGTIPVKFFSRGYNGRVIKTIKLSTNDKSNPYINLRIEGNVIMKDFSRINISPSKIDFNNVTIGEEYTHEVTIKNSGTIPLRIFEIRHDPEIMVKFPKKKIMPKDEITAKIFYTPMVKGRFVTFLKIKTNSYGQYLTIIKINSETK